MTPSRNILRYPQATKMHWNGNPNVIFEVGVNMVTFDASEVSSILYLPYAAERNVKPYDGIHKLWVVTFKNGEKEYLCLEALEIDLDDIVWPEIA